MYAILPRLGAILDVEASLRLSFHLRIAFLSRVLSNNLIARISCAVVFVHFISWTHWWPY